VVFPRNRMAALEDLDSVNLKKGIGMTDLKRRKFVAALGAAPLAVPLLTAAQSPAATSKFQQISSRERTRQKYFPNLSLTTHEGKTVRFYDDLVKDKIVIFNFMYAKCEGICVPITKNLKRVQNLLGKRVGRDIFMYSITLKPEEDTPDKLKHFMDMHRIKPGWTFLTGKPDEINTLRRKLGFSDSKAKLDKDLTNHIGMIRYGNEARQWWAMCPGQANPPWIVESILWMDPKGNDVHTHNTKTKTRKVS